MIGAFVQIDSDSKMGRGILPSHDHAYLSSKDETIYEVLSENNLQYTTLKDTDTGKIYSVTLNANRFKTVKLKEDRLEQRPKPINERETIEI